MAALPGNTVSFQPSPFTGDQNDITQVISWVQNQLANVQNATNQKTLQLATSYNPPAKPRDGLVAFADGTHWNPGAGEGLYVYMNGAWNYLFDSTLPGLPVPVFWGGTGEQSALAARGSGGLNVESGTGKGDTNYSILATDRFVFTTALLTAARTWTLPAANSVNGGAMLVISDVAGGVSVADPILLAPTGTDKIDGVNATMVGLAGIFQTIVLWSDGIANWRSTKALPGHPIAQCQLTLSGANLLLSPYNGNQLWINGQNQTIPSAGITLAVTGATASTFYYIYAFMSGTTMTLEFSTTAPVVSTAAGIKQKTGDATRTLVGAAFTNGTPAWSDSNGNRNVISWFNRRRKSSFTGFSTARTNTGTAGFTEVNSEVRCGFISWAEEEVFWALALDGVAGSAATFLTFTGVGFDSTTSPETPTAAAQAFSTNSLCPSSASSSKSGLSEAAQHFATILSKLSAAGTATYNGATTPNATGLFISVNG